jgi:hypothetical protein
MQPFQQEHCYQGCPNLNTQRVLTGPHEALHRQVLLQSFEQLSDILPINNVLRK